MSSTSSMGRQEKQEATHEGFYRLNLFDIIAIGLILTAASGVLLFTKPGLHWGGSSPSEVSIYYAGRQIHQVDLKQDGELPLSGVGMVMEVREGRVRVRQSDCANRICVNAGWIEQPGEMIACVPNQIIIEIKREEGAFLDAIAR